MTKAYKKYTEYKDSGIEWLGEIPSHWESIRANYVFNIINERSTYGKEELLSVSEHHGVRPRSISNVSMFMAESYIGYKLCKINDLVINSLWAWSRGLGITSYNGIVSTAYSVYRPDLEKYSPSFLNYLLRTKMYVDQYSIYSKGIWISRLQLSDWSFLRIPILSPPLSEQEKIAEFLNRKTKEIDTAIAQKEQLIELLKERKQILINKAVTRGLNPDAQLKDSGIDWIGSIPKHWEVRKLKYIFDNIQTGSTPATTNISYFDGDIKWFTPKDLETNKLFDSERTLTQKAVDDRQIKLFPSNSILVVGIGATSGKCAYNSEEGTFNQQITGFHSKTDSNIFLFHMFSNLSKILLQLANYTTLPILNNEFFKNFRFPLPPLSEQEEIVSYIEEHSAKIDKAIALKQQEIEALKEYKSTLIDSAVRGKICLV